MDSSIQRMNRVVIGVGSNIRAKSNIKKARMKIADAHSILAESSWVKTQPVGNPHQPEFINCAILIDTEMGFTELKKWLRNVEKEMGRLRGKNKYDPRIIDLDVVVWNGRIVDRDVTERIFLRNAVHEVLPGMNL